jgi:hypothetical protein
MTEEEIERRIPKTAAERKKYVESKAKDLEQMKKDISYLLNEVSELKTTNHRNHGDGRDETLKTMDQLHSEKRRQKEEQLLQDHPNFKPGKRLRDTIDEGKTKVQ